MKRKCPDCGNEYPLTSEYFQRDKYRSTGFMSKCKNCQTKRRRTYLRTEKGKQMLRESNDKRQGVNSQIDLYADKSKQKLCSRCGRMLAIIAFSTQRTNPDGLKYTCRDCDSKKVRENSDKYRNMSLVRVSRRRARKASLIDDFTVQDWEYALEYFHHCCAVCGRQLNNLFGEFTAAQDHFIPLSKGGHYIPENIIPLCHGLGGCNNSKHDHMPQEWLERTYGKRKAKEIMARVNQFFASVRQVREDKAS